MKFNDYASVVLSAGYDRSVRAWDCRSHSTEPIQVFNLFSYNVISDCYIFTPSRACLLIHMSCIHVYHILVLLAWVPFNLIELLNLLKHIWDTLQIIDTFLDSVMSVCLTKTEIIAGSVDGTVRTFDIRTGRYVSFENFIVIVWSLPFNLYTHSAVTYHDCFQRNIWQFGATSQLYRSVKWWKLCVSQLSWFYSKAFGQVNTILNFTLWVISTSAASLTRFFSCGRSTGELLQEYKGHTCKVYSDPYYPT